MDVLSSEQRSYCMSQIRGKNTKPELTLRKSLWSIGIRYRLYYNLPGKPDIVFVNLKVALFVDGCFWHGCPKHTVRPKTNTQFWDEKIRKNIERDIHNQNELRKLGWEIIRIWEHDIKESLPEVLRRVQRIINDRKFIKWTSKKSY